MDGKLAVLAVLKVPASAEGAGSSPRGSRQHLSFLGPGKKPLSFEGPGKKHLSFEGPGKKPRSCRLKVKVAALEVQASSEGAGGVEGAVEGAVGWSC